jgi:hypothetical protein
MTKISTPHKMEQERERNTKKRERKFPYMITDTEIIDQRRVSV